MNYAILLSGGTGTRTGAKIPKQYVRAGRHMMVTYALAALFKCEYIDSVYIVSEPEWQKPVMDDVILMGLDSAKVGGFAQPGENRQCSALNGMKCILENNESGDEDTVLVHDAARPFISEELLNRCYEGLTGHDGVMPVLPMKDTVYLSKDAKTVSGLLERKEVFAGQAPELFRLKKYYDANLSLLPDKILKINGATEPAILAGMDMALTEGDERNVKVTTAGDLNRFLEAVDAGEDD